MMSMTPSRLNQFVTRFLAALLLLLPATSSAQESSQTFAVTSREDGWGIMHKVAPGETIFSLSRRFHIPPAILAEANGLTYNDALSTGADIFLPLGAYNQKPALASNVKGAALLNYRMRAQDNLYLVSRHAGVPQRTLQQWNGLKDGQALTGKTLMVGSVLYDANVISAKDVPPVFPANVAIRKPIAAPSFKDSGAKYLLTAKDTFISRNTLAAGDTTLHIKPVSALDSLWREQTFSGKNAVQEKASAGFYQLSGNAPGAASYAFHNSAARGAVIRVKNIANGRVIFVKVLGPIPGGKQYAGCAIGLSNTAKAALGVRESKAFVELSYAGY